ncbi:MAG TPA: hypothetical protein VHC22_12230 [Pirellulales bacterium]|nr:hypothetical protein [Pirellulales bacterium]
MPRTSAEPNKSEIIRKYLARSPRSTGQEIVRAIKRDAGVDVTPGLVSQVKHQAAKASRPSATPAQASGKMRTPVRRSPRAETGTSTLTLESLMAAKKLVHQLGGIEAAKSAVDALAKLA